MRHAASIQGQGTLTTIRNVAAGFERDESERHDLEDSYRALTHCQSEYAQWPIIALMALASICFVVPATKAQQETVSRQSASGPMQTGPSGSVVEHRGGRYQLQSEDVLTISFPLSPEFDQTVTVQPDGYISLFGVGDLSVRGFTIPGLVEALQQTYGAVLNHPIISVGLKDFQTPFFVVSGQVAKPGQFALRYQTTVSEAIALAGGLTPAGKSHVFLLRHSSTGWFKVTPLSLSDIIGKNVEDALLQPGDMVYVPEKFITKFRTYVPYSLGFYTSPQLVF